MKIRYLPSYDEWKRYDPRAAFSMMRRMHQRYTDEYDWFVKPYDHLPQYSRPYYVKGAFPDVDGSEIIDCNWIPENWNKQPWLYRIALGVITEEYRAERSDRHAYGYNAEVVGYKRDGVWLMKYYFGKDQSLYGSPRENMWVMRKGGAYANYSGTESTFHVGTFLYKKPTNRLPDEVAMPVLRGMNRNKYRGFYDDIIDYVMDVGGLRKDQL